MTVTSLPTFPPPIPSQSDLLPSHRRRKRAPRQVRLVVNLFTLVGIVILLIPVRLLANESRRPDEPVPVPVAAPPPVPFRLVMRRFDQFASGSQKDVERFLGPPTERGVWGPEIEEYEEEIRNDRRKTLPENRVWDLWRDPSDTTRWAAVMYKLSRNGAIASGWLKKGF